MAQLTIGWRRGAAAAAVALSLAGAASAADEPAPPVDPLGARLTELESDYFFLLAATCDDITRERQTRRLRRDLAAAREAYVEKTGRHPDFGFVMIEGDGCSGSDDFRRNLSVLRRRLAAFREAIQ